MFAALAGAVLADDEMPTVSHLKAVVGVVKNRAQYQRNLNDLTAFFADNHVQSAACYQAALSNYVEDQWNRLGKQTGCDSETESCKDARPVKFPGMAEGEVTEAYAHYALVLANQAAISNAMYDFILPIINALVPNEALNSFSDGYAPAAPKIKNPPDPGVLKTELTELQGYIDSCATRQATSWAIVGTDIPAPVGSPNLMRAASKLAVYNVLVQNVIGSEAPADKRGYISCLTMFNQFRQALTPCNEHIACIETIPADTKDQLTPLLDDLKAHQCSSSYALDLARRLQITLAVPKPRQH
jgi:hypothetical protein